jgi:riboflavin kinase/FMN adenylyltransferase
MMVDGRGNAMCPWQFEENDMSATNLPLTLHGVVSHGDKRGRILGFPTANLNGVTPREMPFGVYASETRIKGREGKAFASVTSYGTRPTFDGEDTRIETHILDFNEDIYGREIEVRLLAFIRGEARFATVEDLIDAIHSDIHTVRATVAHADQQGQGN